MQVRTALIIIAVVVGLVTWLVLAPAGMPGSTGIAGASEVPVAGVAGFARVSGLAGRLRVEDGRGRPLTPSFPWRA